MWRVVAPLGCNAQVLISVVSLIVELQLSSCGGLMAPWPVGSFQIRH